VHPRAHRSTQSTGLPVYRSTGLPVYRSTGLPVNSAHPSVRRRPEPLRRQRSQHSRPQAVIDLQVRSRRGDGIEERVREVEVRVAIVADLEVPHDAFAFVLGKGAVEVRPQPHDDVFTF